MALLANAAGDMRGRLTPLCNTMGMVGAGVCIAGCVVCCCVVAVAGMRGRLTALCNIMGVVGAGLCMAGCVVCCCVVAIAAMCGRLTGLRNTRGVVAVGVYMAGLVACWISCPASKREMDRGGLSIRVVVDPCVKVPLASPCRAGVFCCVRCAATLE